MSENMKVWNAMKQVPPTYLKKISGGRLSGMSDVNPQWRYQIMTETFGVVGVGWKFEIKRLWQEPAGDGQIFAFAEVAVYHKNGKIWSDPIPGIGGSMLVEKESKGMYANDEGYKMAITDALSTSLKMLGVAADVYAGLWDGTKYKDAPTGTDKQSPPLSGKSPASSATPTTPHFCKEHNTPFFKKGNMKNYAHPIEGTNDWHNEPSAEEIERELSADPPEPELITPTQIAILTELAKKVPISTTSKDLWKDKIKQGVTLQSLPKLPYKAAIELIVEMRKQAGEPQQ